MITYCNHCNTEYTSPDALFCGSCGQRRSGETSELLAPALNLPNSHTVLLRTKEKSAKNSGDEPALVTSGLEQANVMAGLDAPGLSRSDDTAARVIYPASKVKVDVEAEDAESAVEPKVAASEVQTGWQCPQCSYVNLPDAEYCDMCGAMYVSPAEQAAKAHQAHASLAAEVWQVLTPDIEDGVHPGWRLRSGSNTNEGVLRQGHTDEDSVFVLELRRFYGAKPEAFGLYVVADGMGGQAAGEVASRNAIESIAQVALNELALPWMSGQTFEQAQLEQILQKAALAAHTSIRLWNAAQSKDSGSTLTMACILDNRAAFANVGDSRTYLFRRGGEGEHLTDPVTEKLNLTDTAPLPSLENGRRSTDKLKFNGEVRNTELARPAEEVEEQMLKDSTRTTQPYQAIRVTRDQSLVQQLVERGDITIDDVYTDPRRNVVLNGLGTSEETIPVDTYYRELQAGDRILLCSDGLWEMVRDPALAETLTQLADAQVCSDELIKLACRNGGADNVSVIVVDIER